MLDLNEIITKISTRINTIQNIRDKKTIDDPNFIGQQWARQDELASLLSWIEKENKKSSK